MNNNIEVLNDSFIFQLCMSDKELFHSNFLYGLWKKDPSNFRRLLEEFKFSDDNYDSLVGKREYNNYDFCLIDKNDKVVLIIENKVKSIPRKEQLDRYYKDFKDNNDKPYFILLSLMETFPEKEANEGDKRWKLVTYNDLIAELNKRKWSINLKQYVKDYCTAMTALVNEVNKYEISHKSLYFQFGNKKEDNKTYEEYKELRIHDLFEKLWFSQIAQYVAKEINENDFINEKGFKCDWYKECKGKEIIEDNTLYKLIHINSGYTVKGGGGILDLKILFKPGIILGMQIQGDAYRRIFEYKAENNFKQDEYDWFFDLESECKYNKKEKEANFQDFKDRGEWKYYRDRGNGLFLKFGSNFKYQQLKIREDLKIKELSKLILRDIELILSHFGTDVSD